MQALVLQVSLCVCMQLTSRDGSRSRIDEFGREYLVQGYFLGLKRSLCRTSFLAEGV